MRPVSKKCRHRKFPEALQTPSHCWPMEWVMCCLKLLNFLKISLLYSFCNNFLREVPQDFRAEISDSWPCMCRNASVWFKCWLKSRGSFGKHNILRPRSTFTTCLCECLEPRAVLQSFSRMSQTGFVCFFRLAVGLNLVGISMPGTLS